MRSIICASILFLVAGTTFAGYLTEIEIEEVDGITRVTFSGDDSFIYTDFTLTDPYRIVMDVTGFASLLQGSNFADVGRGGVSGIFLNRFEKGNFLRIVTELDQPLSYTISEEANGLALFVSSKTGPFAPWKATGSQPSSNPGHSNPGKKTPVVEAVQEPLVSMDLENANVLTVLRAFSEYAGRNIVADQDVKGTVTVRLRRVPWSQALDIILKSAGLARTYEDGIIRVAPTGKLETEKIEEERKARELERLTPMRTKVYTLEFATAKETKEPAQKMLSDRGTLEIDERTNSLVVTDIDPVHKEMISLLTILDSATPQVEIIARIVEVNYDYVREIGVKWGVSDLRSEDLHTTAEVDMPVVPGEDIAGAISFRLGSVTDWATVAASISALENEGKASLVSHPRISAVNHKAASVFAGKQIPITTIGAEGRVTTRYVSAGIGMNVTPHINSLDDITLDLTAELSEPDFAITVGGLPTISTSKANSRVLLQNGETVVLGGLKKVTESDRVIGVPIIRHIPLLGNLFKRTGKTKEEREILIFVTPYIIKKV
jgi:type IV pilus assembly protein PilQ